MIQFIEYAGMYQELGQSDLRNLSFQATVVVVKGALPLSLIACVLAVLSTGVRQSFYLRQKRFSPS